MSYSPYDWTNAPIPHFGNHEEYLMYRDPEYEKYLRLKEKFETEEEDGRNSDSDTGDEPGGECDCHESTVVA